MFGFGPKSSGLRKGMGWISGTVLIILWAVGPVTADPGSCPGVSGKKMRWIVPNAVGGGYDTYSRLIAPHYAKALGSDIVVENIKGAGGIVGSKVIADAKPDGLTIGILNGSGLMVAALAGDAAAPDPSKDFTILGRIVRNQQVWAAATNSPFKTIEDVFREAEKRPILFATRDVGSVSFVSMSVGSYLLGMNHEIVPGYSGSGAGVLAAMRGEVDLVSYTFESILEQIEEGEMRPLLQITDKPISDHPSLKNVPLLGGDRGVAAKRAGKLGRDEGEAVSEAKALAELIGAGRLVAAPLGLPEALSSCMDDALYRTLNDPEFQTAAEKASRSLHTARGEAATDDLRVVKKGMGRFGDVIKGAIEKIRE